MDESNLSGDQLQYVRELEAENKRHANAMEFMGRKLALMIPKVRIDEQIRLDEFEIGSIITWHNKMAAKCNDNGLFDRMEYHIKRAEKLKAALPEEDNSAA